MAREAQRRHAHCALRDGSVLAAGTLCPRSASMPLQGLFVCLYRNMGITFTKDAIPQRLSGRNGSLFLHARQFHFHSRHGLPSRPNLPRRFRRFPRFRSAHRRSWAWRLHHLECPIISFAKGHHVCEVAKTSPPRRSRRVVWVTTISSHFLPYSICFALD